VFDTEADVYDRFVALVPRPIWALRGLQAEAKPRDPADENLVSRTMIAGRREQEALVIVHQDPVWRRHSGDVFDLKPVGLTLPEGRRICWGSVGQLVSCARDVLDDIVAEAQVVGGFRFHDRSYEVDGP
jgi:hypothetical protein